MALTVAQLAAIQQGHAEAKLAVEIDATTPIRYCSGENPVQVGADWYTPRWMRGNYFDFAAPTAARTTIEIDDRDKAIETAWYSDRHSGYDVNVHILLRQAGERDWTTVTSITWVCEAGGTRSGRDYVLKLHAAQGHKQRYGLTIGNSSIFPWAPPAGVTFKFASGSTTVSPPSSPAETNPYAELYGTTSSTYWSLIDPTGQMAFDAGLERPYWVSEANWAALDGGGTGGIDPRRPDARHGA